MRVLAWRRSSSPRFSGIRGSRWPGSGTRPSRARSPPWHDGFDRYDFVMDDENLAIQPFKRPEDEGFGVEGPGEGPAALYRHRSEAAGAGQPVVVARLLLGPRAPGRSRTAPAGFSRRLHHARPRQGMGRLVRLPHREAWPVEEAGVRRHEQGRSQRVRVGHSQPRQGLVHLCRQSRDPAGRLR